MSLNDLASDITAELTEGTKAALARLKELAPELYDFVMTESRGDRASPEQISALWRDADRHLAAMSSGVIEDIVDWVDKLGPGADVDRVCTEVCQRHRDLESELVRIVAETVVLLRNTHGGTTGRD
jgi:hypothetical protein